MSDLNKVNQSKASAEKMAGRDFYETNIQPRLSHVEKLVELLEKEIEKDETRENWIESLEFFESPFSPDGVEGLEAKLVKAGRSTELVLAIKYKEMFAKFLSRYALYQSAQELIALCLHKVFHEFESRVHPVCGGLSQDELNEIITAHVVEPLFKDYSYGAFNLHHGLIQGMIFWLADRCFVRWHAA